MNDKDKVIHLEEYIEEVEARYWAEHEEAMSLYNSLQGMKVTVFLMATYIAITTIQGIFS